MLAPADSKFVPPGDSDHDKPMLIGTLILDVLQTICPIVQCENEKTA
jgi:hypothetical protein